ncbi:MAG: hypothetical protein QOG54_1818 [Actinomycetota bacterium]|jgi:hypothetical protein|nr:hypothetical protein [Actinomycetota bacterium]
MQAVADAFQYVNAAAFLFLGLLGARVWMRRHDSQSAWMSLTFGILGVIAIIGLVQPEKVESDLGQLLLKFEIGVLLLFPYFLYRFAASFDPPSRRTEYLAAIVTGIAIIWPFFLGGNIPQQGERQTTEWRIYILVLLFQWTLLSILAAVRLWRGGGDLPEVARRRTHLLSIATLLLSVVIIISGSSSSEPAPEVQVITAGMTLVAALAFYFGFSPPRFVLMVWRRPAQDALYRAVTDLVSAETEQDVTSSLLPHVTDIIGGRAVALVEREEVILDAHGATQEMLDHVPGLLNDPQTQREGVIVVPLTFATVIVWTSRFAPFFGEEELELVKTLGTLGHFALERTRATRLKADLAEAQRRREQALQINDNVVQGLAVAKYSFEMGLQDRGIEAIDKTLSAARSIISDLLEEIGGDTNLEAGALIRHEPAGFDPERSAETGS